MLHGVTNHKEIYYYEVKAPFKSQGNRLIGRTVVFKQCKVDVKREVPASGHTWDDCNTYRVDGTDAPNTKVNNTPRRTRQ